MKRVWFDVINNDDWQPFCAVELRHQPQSVDYQLAVGCSHGALLFYHIPKAISQSSIGAKSSVTDYLMTNQISLKRRMQVKKNEPITHMHELREPH